MIYLFTLSTILKAGLLVNFIDFRLSVLFGLFYVHCAFIICRHPRHFLSRKDGLFPLSNFSAHSHTRSSAPKPGRPTLPSSPLPFTDHNLMLFSINFFTNITNLVEIRSFFFRCIQTHGSEDGRGNGQLGAAPLVAYIGFSTNNL